VTFPSVTLTTNAELVRALTGMVNLEMSLRVRFPAKADAIDLASKLDS